MIDLQVLLKPYNPWWSDPLSCFANLPQFKRPIFQSLLEDLRSAPQMLSITGPRRIGKSTLLYQLLQTLLEEGTSPQHLVYYSFDDPALATRRANVDDLFDQAMKLVLRQKKQGRTYLFFDEIQRLERWELYLKKYYDLRYPVKVVISGSASSPIFKKSRESLLGRVKDFHLLPFSFREYALYHLREDQILAEELDSIHGKGKTIQGIFTEDPAIRKNNVELSEPSEALRNRLDSLLLDYFLQGGFPEVWSLPTWVAQQEYLYDNQVKKVIYEDLILAAEFRKPELLKRFYISLLEMPGKEISVQTVTKETNVAALQIEKYLPLLEMTDLVYRISKFRKGPLRVRKGLMKFYLVDLALRNAALRLNETLLQDDTTLGLYAENLVFLALKKWRGMIQMDYYRERHGEVDFVVHIGPHRYLPVEVKYRNEIKNEDFGGLQKFTAKFKQAQSPILVTKNWTDFGWKDNTFLLPLPIFLVLFD